MTRFVAFAATLMVVAASAGESDVSGTGGLSLSFPTSRLWAPPDPANVAMRNAMSSSDTSAVFAEYHANLAHAGLAAKDATDNQIEKEHMTERVTEEMKSPPSQGSDRLPQRLDGLLQENVPRHTGDHVLDRLAALHELVERKRAMRHAGNHGDLLPGASDPNAFLQPSPPYTGTEMSFDAQGLVKPPVAFTETAAEFPPSRPAPSSDGLLDPAEVQDGTLNQDGSHIPATSSFSSSPMSRSSTSSALGHGDAIVSNLDSVTAGLKKIHGLRGASYAPSSPPLTQGSQWPPSLASAPFQPSIPAATPGFSAASHAAPQMDPNFAAAIGAAAPDLAQPMSMSFNSPPAGADVVPPLPPKSTDNMMSPVQALMTNTDSGFESTSLPASFVPPSLSPNGAHLFDAPQPAKPATPIAAEAPIAIPAAFSKLPSPQAAQVPQASALPTTLPIAPQVTAQAGMFQPTLPPMSFSAPLKPLSSAPVAPSNSAPVFQPPVPPLSAVNSFSEPVPLGSTVSSVDADLQRVSQTTAEDEQEIERIQAQMASNNPDVKLWIPNSQPAAAAHPKAMPQPVRMPAMTAAAGPAPTANRVQSSSVASPPVQQLVASPQSTHTPGSSAVGSAPVTPVFDADGNRIDADSEAMLHDLKGEVANFEQRVTAMEHQEASLLQTDEDSAQ